MKSEDISIDAMMIAMSKNKKLKPFKYNDEGSLAIIGRYRAVADLFLSKFHVGGFLALIIWLFIHLISLVTYRNKLKTLSEWIIAYSTRDQSLRMIVRHDTRVAKENVLLDEQKFQKKSKQLKRQSCQKD